MPPPYRRSVRTALSRRLRYRVLLSIIVPVHDSEEYLLRCLRSLLDQDLERTDYEVIVVNDGSEDHSLAIAEAFAHSEPNVVIHSQENQGPSAARNAGIDLARGKYIYFVDSDDHVASQVLGGLVKLMDREALQVLAFGSSDVGPSENLPFPRYRHDTAKGVEVTPGTEYLATHQYPDTTWWYMVNRAFLIDLGVRFEVGRIVEDVVFTATVVSAATRFAFVPTDVYRYAHRPGSLMRTRTDAGSRRVVADLEHAVLGLEELRQRFLRSGKASPALLDRLANHQQGRVFVLITKSVQSQSPARSILPGPLERLRAINMYPLDHYPGPDDKGLQAVFLTFVYNRGYLLYPFAMIYKRIDGLQRLLGRGPRG
jgi:Glycosyl transferase family 2